MHLRTGGLEVGRSKMRASMLCVITAAVLAACGSEEPPPPAPTPAPARQPQAKVEKAPEDPTTKMARAVATAGASAPIDVRYEIPTKPLANQPIEMDLAVLVSTGADSLTLAFEPSPGLTVISEPPPQVENVQPGAPVMAKLAVSAEQPDVFYVKVVATIHSGGVPTTRNYAIPLIFSEPPPASEPAPEASEPSAQTTAEAPPKP